jgi:hypothetical protein
MGRVQLPVRLADGGAPPERPHVRRHLEYFAGRRQAGQASLLDVRRSDVGEAIELSEQESDEYHLGREGNEDSRARLTDGKLRRWREKVSTLVQTQVTDAE